MIVEILKNIGYSKIVKNEDNTIEITEEQLNQIGETLQFDMTTKTLIPYTPPIDNSQKIAELENWFNTTYSPQLEQAMRAERGGNTWQHTDTYFNITYNTIAELDNQADSVQNMIRELKGE